MAVNDFNKLTGKERVAIILLAATEKNSTKLFSLMTDEEIKEVSQAMSNLGSVDADVKDKVISQFSQEIMEGSSFSGNIETTEKLLTQVLPKDQVSSVLEDIKGPEGKNTWEKLGNVNEEVLSAYLRNEHPQTVALIISKLDPEHSARLLISLPEELTYDVITRMLNISNVKKEVLDRVERILQNEFISSISRTQKYDSYEVMAEIFNRFDRNTESKFMGMLEESKPEEATKIKDLMFTFEDLLKIDSNGAQALIRAVDKGKLTIALKGASDKVRDMFLNNMSQRAAKILKEEMESMGAVRVKDVDEAQSTIINTARDLIDQGEIIISEGEGDEFI
jgi:flagellar motor switch protein FliG